MTPLLIWPNPAPPDLVRVLDMAGLEWSAVSGTADAADQIWAGAIVSAEESPKEAFAVATALRNGDLGIGPLLLLVRGTHLTDLRDIGDAFDDFCVTPFHPSELEARVRHMLGRAPGVELDAEVIHYDGLTVNIATYQASIDDRPLDLTYMEYELLRFLASSPGRVFSRETLLSHVWGYDYYGGARTVDVHIRRLRAKLGEEHAGMIQTVRSVGYRFGESRLRSWNSDS
ncbi:MAG: response regulator transcription factor [Microthrixaceae bacterium]